MAEAPNQIAESGVGNGWPGRDNAVVTSASASNQSCLPRPRDGRRPESSRAGFGHCGTVFDRRPCVVPRSRTQRLYQQKGPGLWRLEHQRGAQTSPRCAR